MTRLAAFVAVLLAVLDLVAPARADDGDGSTLAATSALIGQQVGLTVEVAAPRDATVEVDPASPGWNGVAVIRTGRAQIREEGGRAVHRLELVVAPFAPGPLSFTPAVTILRGDAAEARVLPPVSWTVLATLNPGEPLELSPLAPPEGIGGAESPLLRPALGLAAALVALMVGTLLFLAVRAVRRRLGRRPAAATEPEDESPLAGLEELLLRDPARAYRRLAATVRRVIAARYGFPAHALTTFELRRRMEGEGVDRWQARLVAGLLEECDAVVYAGYRPAPERRTADLTMAREIVEAGA
ncbi:MAG: hypothetical protein IT304_00125 [Dehalococcoidia bacterium]|nr:hypothetical protein [Dehalococcoidia bacterium]